MTHYIPQQTLHSRIRSGSGVLRVFLRLQLDVVIIRLGREVRRINVAQ